MENASKALIIAGAILLSILIIALGMSVYNSSKSASANADLSATEVSSFNSTFEAYEGKQKGSTVRTLITSILSSNAKNTDKPINLSGKTTPGAITTAESNKTFTVTFGYNSDTGLIESCTITDN